ncbi:MAG: SPFH domain-containing protein, partial [Clostridia bacterium]|nr:SPFH domain-containing protein [Clostridia bacterium]
MGLISALVGAAGGVLADQWKEFFYCEAMDKDVLVTKGQKVISGRSSNTKGNDNIISNGSKIAVADGQCMMIVESGKIVEVCAEPGEFIYDTSTEPSIFYGSLGKGILDLFKQIGKRFTFGGDPGKDQRVYYFNIKEIIDNKFGTPNPVPFRVVDSRIHLDLDVSIRCSGVYSYKITNPLLFYTNVCGNVEKEYTRDQIDAQLKTEFVSALQPALGKLSDLEIRPNQIVTHNTDLENAMNDVLSGKWSELRGIEVVSVALGSVTLPEEDQELIKKAQRAAMLMDPTYAGATVTA